MPIVKCRICAKKFYVKPFWRRRGFGRYCSPTCQHLGRRTGRLVICDTCGQEIYRSRKALNISRSGKFFCSKSCQTRWRNITFVGPKHANWRHGKFVYRTILNRHGVAKFCRLCGNKDVRVLEVHHVDKNRRNNAVSNLIWLCRNCHFFVHHHEQELQKLMVLVV